MVLLEITDISNPSCRTWGNLICVSAWTCRDTGSLPDPHRRQWVDTPTQWGLDEWYAAFALRGNRPLYGRGDRSDPGPPVSGADQWVGDSGIRGAPAGVFNLLAGIEPGRLQQGFSRLGLLARDRPEAGGMGKKGTVQPRPSPRLQRFQGLQRIRRPHATQPYPPADLGGMWGERQADPRESQSGVGGLPAPSQPNARPPVRTHGHAGDTNGPHRGDTTVPCEGSPRLVPTWPVLTGKNTAARLLCRLSTLALSPAF